MKVALVLLDETRYSGFDFADMGANFLRKTFQDMGEAIEFDKFEYIVDGELPDPLEYGLVYLTGSKKDSYEETPFNDKLIEFIRDACSQNVKILGICYGHQIIARSMGFKTAVNPLGWELGNHTVQLSEEDQRKLGVDFDEYTISMIHQDIVTGDSERFVGSTEKCGIQGITVENVLTFKGHPEFTSDLVLEMSKKKLQEAEIDREHFNDIVERSQLLEDGMDDNGNKRLREIVYKFVL